LSSEKGSASASKGGMSNKTAQSSAVVQGIKADEYAKKKLGITQIGSGIIATQGENVVGQMYGAEYQAARNEYLASQGLGTVRADGGFMAGVQTDKGLTFTNATRGAYEASKREPIPLSKQMYKSQQRFQQIAGAIATGFSGMPSFYTASYLNTQKPYAEYVNEFYNKNKMGNNMRNNMGNYSFPTFNTPNKDKKVQTIDIRDTPKKASDQDAAARGDEKALARIQKLAASKSEGSPNRKFLISSAKTFLGKMKSGNLDADYSTF
tara:strand:- start:106 stop:900 length:795 start_codon:yes stop_codon:yes gene_type:complete